FIIHRRDGLFAYNLAVVVDDHFKGITVVVRGADLIEPTVREIVLYQQFGWPAPRHLHLPLVLNPYGNKLSKQNHAPPLPACDSRPSLWQALRFFGLTVIDDWRAIPVCLL
ncbi:tRNA glutamyl-Q(34) synthetase GluQRS, partial [Erwinia amylovora]|uniref:glutamate--tRNA ligase family protein n=1 Tax=Erwinia amylovora TaxID=552 RepID=UPI00100774E5